MALALLRPDWPAPQKVQVASTIRLGGVSAPPYDSLNLATHVGDDPQAVAANRTILQEQLQLPTEPVWLDQVHGAGVVSLDGALTDIPKADASVTQIGGVVCVVQTADCLPVLFCSRQGTRVAAAHAGWRGLAAGVLEATVARLDTPAEDILAWLGPAIGPRAFEVGEEVHEAFVAVDPEQAQAFVETRPGHWRADLYQLARRRLHQAGVTAVYGGSCCTYEDAERFYSYRRDGVTGRMASLIWLSP